MIKSRLSLVVALFAAGVIPTVGRAQTFQYTRAFQVDQDTYVRGGSFAETNFGSEPTIDVAMGSGADERRGYLEFTPYKLIGRLIEGSLHARAEFMNEGADTIMPVVVRGLIDERWRQEELTYNNAPNSFWDLSTTQVYGQVRSTYVWDVKDAIDAMQLRDDDHLALVLEATRSSPNVVEFDPLEVGWGARVEVTLETTPAEFFSRTCGDSSCHGSSGLGSRNGFSGVLTVPPLCGKSEETIWSRIDEMLGYVGCARQQNDCASVAQNVIPFIVNELCR